VAGFLKRLLYQPGLSYTCTTNTFAGHGRMDSLMQLLSIPERMIVCFGDGYEPGMWWEGVVEVSFSRSVVVGCCVFGKIFARVFVVVPWFLVHGRVEPTWMQ
jgi:hypothetical protein